jgi:hypothetical protein
MQYVKGKDNVVVDALSCCPLVNAIYMVKNIVMLEINKYYTQDQLFKKPYENFEKEHKTLEIYIFYQAYTLDGGAAYYGIKVCILHFKDFHVKKIMTIITSQ